MFVFDRWPSYPQDSVESFIGETLLSISQTDSAGKAKDFRSDLVRSLGGGAAAAQTRPRLKSCIK
jgi:hypothetical protein